MEAMTEALKSQDIIVIIPAEIADEFNMLMTPRGYQLMVQRGIDALLSTTAEPYTAMSARTTLQQQLAAANAKIAELTKANASQSALLKTAMQDIQELNAANAEQASELREALARIEELDPTPDPPVSVPGTIDDTLPKFATYITDKAGNSPTRTATMQAYVDTLAAAGVKEVVMLCNDAEIAQGTLSEYMDTRKVGWWADTFRAVYLVCEKKTAVDAANPNIKEKRDFFAETMTRVLTFKALRGFVLDDVHSISPADFAEVVEAMRKYTTKPIVASFMADTDVTIYGATLKKYNVKVARQFYRHELAGKDTPEKRTGILTTWLKTYHTDVVDLEYFQEGSTLTTGADLKEMYNRCISAGVKSFQGYAAVNTDGFKIWEHADLWQAFKDCNAAYPGKVAI